MNYKVYMHTFPNGKRYIGCTNRDVEKRWKYGSGYVKNETMFNDILFYGWKNILHEVLYEDLSKEEAYKIESDLIIKFKTYEGEYGYNISQGNVSGVQHISDDGIERIRAAMSSRCVSEESREKMRLSKIGNKHHCQKHTEETKALISQKRKGKRAKENHPMAKPVYCVELDKVFPYAKNAEEETGVSRSHICQVCKGKRKTAGKMHWRYVE